MPILEVNQLSKQFTIHHLERHIGVFSEVSFEVSAGEFVLIRGGNGVGKSTLLRCLYRSYLPTSGQAMLHTQYGPVDLATAADIDIALLRREAMSFVTQFLRPRPRVTALELVAEPLLDNGLYNEEATSQAEGMLAEFGLKSALWSAYPTTFSGGEQQKVNLARSLIHPKKLLLLDEPTASLDAATRTALAQRLAHLKQQGVAMVAVLHHPEDVANLIDKEVMLEVRN